MRSPEGAEWVRVGGLFGVAGRRGRGPGSGTAGWSVGDARLILSGNLGHGFGYVVRNDMARDRTLLDLAIHLDVTPGLRLQAGRAKVPFSAEFLTPAAQIDMVDRAAIVRALAPGRDVGVQVAGRTGVLAWTLGVSNGNNDLQGNDDDRLLTALRLTATLEGHAAGRVVLGAGGAASNDSSAPLGEGLPATFDGHRRLAGADLRWESGAWLASAEGLWGRLDARGARATDIWGFHTTVGHTVIPTVQALLRWDVLEPDAALGPSQRWAIASLAIDATPPTPVYFQVEYRLDANDPGERDRILVTADVAF